MDERGNPRDGQKNKKEVSMNSAEECWASELRSLDHYIANSHEKILKTVAKEEELDGDKIEGKEEYKKRIEEGKKKIFI